MHESIVIKRKLGIAIYPYVLSAAKLKKTSDYSIYHWYNHTKEVISALAGVGIGTSLAYFLEKGALLENMQLSSIGMSGVVMMAAVGYFRNRAGKEDIIQKVLGQKKIMRQFLIIENRIKEAVQESDPQIVINKLIIIQQESSTLVNNAIQEGVWPDKEIIDACVYEDAKIKAESLINTLQPDWAIAEVNNSELPDQRIN